MVLGLLPGLKFLHPAEPVMFLMSAFFVIIACDEPNDQPHLHVGTFADELDKFEWLQPSQKKLLFELAQKKFRAPEDLEVVSPRPWRAEAVNMIQRRAGITDLSTLDMDPLGAFECRCATALPADVVPIYASRGYPADYGLGVCKKHDQNLASATAQADTGCTPGANQDLYCSMEWCYVDLATCDLDELKCKKAGFKVGSFDSLDCRSRPREVEDYLWLRNTSNVYFSYQTCGNRDFYSNSIKSVQSSIAGRVVTVVLPTAAYAPWTFPPNYAPDALFDQKNPEWQGNGGILVKFVAAVAASHDPPLVPKLLKGFASKRSKRFFNSSSYTACVMDVAVQNVDICIGDFWMTAERLGMGVSFVHPFGSDDFYIIAPKAVEDALTFEEMLARPWQPFELNLWLCFVGFVAFASIVTMLTDSVLDLGHEYEREKETDGDFDNPTLIGRYFRALQLNSLGYVNGGTQNSPSSVPARLAQIGFGWFLLIFCASYSANLASILVAKSGRSGGIANIQDAINKKARICTVPQILQELQVNYPGATFKTFVDAPTVVRALNVNPPLGECDVGLLTSNHIKRALAGQYNTEDCNANATTCVKDDVGTPNKQRDCARWRMVGQAVLTVPLSFPVAPQLFTSFTYTLQVLKSIGEQATIIKAERDRVEFVTRSACSSADVTAVPSLQLPLSSMAGTFIIALFFQMVALILSMAEFIIGRPVQDWFRTYDHNEVMQQKKLAAGQSSRLALGFITHLSVRPKGRQTAKVASALNDAPEVKVDGNTDTPVEQSAARPSAWP